MSGDPDLTAIASEVVSPSKAAPRSLGLRARPPRVARFRRGLVIGAVGIVAIALSGLAWFALSPRALQAAKAPTVSSAVDRGTSAEAVRQLPSDYAQGGAPPRLGPPLPGDLGRAVINHQRRDGLVVGDAGSDTPMPQPSTDQQAVDAERQWREGQARQAREAGVMVQVTRRAEAAVAPNLLASPEFATPPPVSSPQGIGEPGDQNRKMAFMGAVPGGESIYTAHQLETPRSPYQVMAGTVISASLITGLNSDRSAGPGGRPGH